MLNVLPAVESNLKAKVISAKEKKKTGTLFEELLGRWICHQLRWGWGTLGDLL